jgi:hypothetical protein
MCLIAVVGPMTADLVAQSVLIPDTTRRDMVFDFTGQYLYITTSTGFVETYNLSTQAFGTIYNLSGPLMGSLNGVDIARDNSFLIVAEDFVPGSSGLFYRLDLATGNVTNIYYDRAFGEGGAWDVAIASNGLALVSTEFGGSGWTPLRQIDLTTNAVSVRSDAPGSGPNGTVRQNTQIYRSADGTRFFFMESNISSGPAFTYSATTNAFGPSGQTNVFLDHASGAVSRDGSLVALRTFATASLYTAPGFGFVHSFSGIDSGVAFDAVNDIVYGVNSSTDQIIAFSTTSFAELFRLNIGENVTAGATMFGNGTLISGADGRYLALETASGIRLFVVPEAGTPLLLGLGFLFAIATSQRHRWWR